MSYIYSYSFFFIAEGDVGRTMQIELTEHARARLEKRHILDHELIDALKYPERILKKHGKYYYQKTLQGGLVELVCERRENHIKVITIYWL